MYESTLHRSESSLETYLLTENRYVEVNLYWSRIVTDTLMILILCILNYPHLWVEMFLSNSCLQYHLNAKFQNFHVDQIPQTLLAFRLSNKAHNRFHLNKSVLRKFCKLELFGDRLKFQWTSVHVGSNGAELWPMH